MSSQAENTFTSQKGRIELLMEQGIALVQRRMVVGVPYLESNIDGYAEFPLAANFFTGLHALEHLYEEPDDGSPEVEDIEIDFMNYGGDLMLSLAIYDRLRMVKVPVNIYVYGPYQSGGSLILQATTKRYLSQNSALMLHYGYTGDEGNSDPKRLEEALRHHKYLMERMIDIYYSRCNHTLLTKEKFRDDIMRIESYFEAEKCIELGLADEILEPTVKFKR
ncbi:MAG: ATP-dependent Clp protease proteolytic subunit [Patescibacteria group bacterium]|nr:ATP-dependent Clp protease proteolytic subunit [Patescibacteria group bacterium]